MEYELERSPRRTISIEVKPDGRVVVKAPTRAPRPYIDRFVKEKEEWIERAKEKVLLRKEKLDSVEKLSENDIRELKKKAFGLIIPLVEDYAEIMGVECGHVTIRIQKSRWGSCSGRGNLNFNCLLALCPESVIRYVVVHELCHIKYMNHSEAFWAMVSEFMPDYKEQRIWLKRNGSMLIARLP